MQSLRERKYNNDHKVTDLYFHKHVNFGLLVKITSQVELGKHFNISTFQIILRQTPAFKYFFYMSKMSP